MVDKFLKGPQDVSSPATGGQTITPSDATDLANDDGAYPTAFYLAEAGAFSYIDMWDNTVTIAALGAGWYPLRCKKIRDTGTDATEILLAWQDNPEA